MSAGRGASTLANMIDSIQNSGKIPAGISRSSSLLVEKREPQIEGFSVSETQPVGPGEYQFALKSIQNSGLDSVQKAKRLNLLNKQGRIYIGQ